MSMFYELMMRKKTEIMYATIKGSLTENDGVFSGFSASNYLLTQDNIAINTNQNFEIRVTFTTGGDVSSFKHLLETYGHPYDFYIDFKDDRFRFKFFDANNTSVIYTLWHSITTNTQYTVIWQYISATNTHNISLVQNGVVIASNSNTSTIYSYNYPFAIGCSDIVGSIDLNNSYIKIGSTKYKLQAVVGYTVVGSPTISDGVVSGFSHNTNYLSIPPFSGNDNFEGCFVFKANVIKKMPIFSTNNYFTNGFYLNANGKITCTFHQETPEGKYYSITTTFVCQANVKYYGKFKKSGNILSFAISTDNISWQEQYKTLDENCVFNSTTNKVGDGGGETSVAFDGEIYIQESWIKVNNKLFFNGQQS